MKLTSTVLLVTLLTLAGCAITEQAEVPPIHVELISMTQLPPLKTTAYAGGMKFNLLLHVMKDGTVEHVKMLQSSGDAEWDSLALQSVRQWRFAVPRRNGEPTDVWLRQLVVVQVQVPLVMTIGEVGSADLREADSLYALLEKGTALDTLFRQSLKTINVMTYPQHIREELKELREGEFTRPLRVGGTYIIYKRFPRGASTDPTG